MNTQSNLLSVVHGDTRSIRTSFLGTVALRAAIGLSAIFGATGCDPADGDLDEEAFVDEDDEVSLRIKNGTAASLWARARMAALGNCTATIIGPRHLLTASHCTPSAGEYAAFYTSTSDSYVPANTSVTRKIESVDYRPGVLPSINDFTDNNGDFADFAVLRLSSNIPSTSAVATMAWIYPSGGDDWGTKVGAGQHDGGTNNDWDLRSTTDQTYSDNDNDGHFLTENEETDGGDSGGAFFFANRLLGVLYGDVFEWEMRNKYSSVPHHLNWILTTMAYTFPGGTQSGVIVNGTTSASPFANSSRMCAYICEKTSSCVAFNFNPANLLEICQIKSSNTGTLNMPGATSGVK